MVDEQGSEEHCLEGSGCKAQRDVVVAVQVMVSLEMMIMITIIRNDKKKNKMLRAAVAALMVVVIRMMWRGVHIEKNETEYVILVSYST